jgi:hypothetical protein
MKSQSDANDRRGRKGGNSHPHADVLEQSDLAFDRGFVSHAVELAGFSSASAWAVQRTYGTR